MAFENRDYQTAARLWRQQARAGSTKAKMGLGLMSDMGLGTAHDPSEAFRWYLEAAQDGAPDAQFNVAVMLDSGIGTIADPARAFEWYTRAALRGNQRAQYNLGLLFNAGIGTAKNFELAEYWFKQAAGGLPAAQQKLLEDRPVGAPSLPNTAPVLVFGSLNGDEIELVWSAVQGEEGDRYFVELLETPGTEAEYSQPISTAITSASGILTKVNNVQQAAAIWRVSRLSADGSGYFASTWQGSEAKTLSPKGRVVIASDPGHSGMRAFVNVLSRDLRANGFWVRLQALDALQRPEPEASSDVTSAQTSVSYRFRTDEQIAKQVADILPILSPGDVTLDLEFALFPGEVLIRIGGSPLVAD